MNSNAFQRMVLSLRKWCGHNVFVVLRKAYNCEDLVRKRFLW